MKPDQTRLTTLLKDTVILLCKNGLNFRTTLRIEGVLGITIDNSDVFIVHLNESVSDEVETPSIVDILDSSSDRETGGTNGNGDRVAERQAVQNSKHDFVKSCRMANASHRVAMAPSGDEAEPIKHVSGLVQDAETVDCNSFESIRHQMDICFKEESSDNASIGDAALAGTSGNDNDGSAWKNDRAVESSEDTSFRRNKGKKPDAPVPPPGNSEVSGEVFFPNKEIKAEEDDGDWNFDSLAVANLPAGTDGEAPPWFGFTWNGVPLGTEHHSADPDRLLSQSQVPSNHSYIKRRSLRDDVIYPGMQRQFRHGNVAMLKPFACPVAGCNRRFFHRNNVYRHRKQKHGEGIE